MAYLSNNGRESGCRRKQFFRLLVCVLLLGTGCNESVTHPAPIATNPEDLDFLFFDRLVEPILMRRGCAAASCHGGQGSGELLLTAGLNPAADYVAVVNLTNPTDPGASPLVLKPLAVSEGGDTHSGGEIFVNTQDADYRVLVNWIAGESLP